MISYKIIRLNERTLQIYTIFLKTTKKQAKIKLKI
jgi:hypothetical protein